MKRVILGIVFIILTFISVTFAVSAILLNSNKILNSFSIISVDNASNVYSVNFEKVKTAEYYDVLVYNEKNIPIYSKSIYKNNIQMTLDNIEYDSKYKIVIYAYNKLGDSIGVHNPYVFTYTEPTFDLNNSLVLKDNEDYKLQIKGKLNKKDYIIRILDNNYKLKEEKLNDNSYIIDKKYYTGLKQKLDVEIVDGVSIISKISLFNNMSPVGDIEIKTPKNGDVLNYNDVVLNYDGGDNASSYLLQIYKDDTLIKETEVKKNNCVIASELFEKAEKYKIKINALYKDYKEMTKSSEVFFTMNEKDTLKPAFINYNPKYIKAGTKLELHNPNQDGTIYYTTNGEDPVTNGVKYSGPIAINENMEIKTVIMEPKKNNSIIKEFKLNVGSKENLKIYLSPSNQDGNKGVKESGYTNEMKEMNDLADLLAKKLTNHGVKIYRNNPLGNINLWVSDSRYLGVDLHLAIHSNASINHNVYGIETWIDKEESKSYSLANMIQKSLIGIYYNEEPDANRGVKYAFGSLGEVNDLMLPFGILLEVAHHDYEKDALWIMENKDLIANTIGNAILKYYGII